MGAYSTKPLAQKLGIASGMKMLFLNESDTFRNTLGSMVNEVHVAQSMMKGETYDYIHLFVHTSAELKKQAEMCLEHLVNRGMLWVSWPKQSANVPTDLTEQTLRDVLLPQGVDDIKACAIDTVWGGLKFVWRRTA